MSYDIYFLRREPGQSWDDAMAALEEQAEDGEAPSRPARWHQVVAGVREVLGDVSLWRVRRTGKSMTRTPPSR